MTTNRAPAGHLRYPDHQHGDVILIDVQVPKAGFQQHTYYSCMNFNQGGDGGGYCGLTHQGKTYLFSMWDPHTATTEKITAPYKGLWTKTHYFGHEGHGLHSENDNLGWLPDQWYTLAMRSWDEGKHTEFGFWVHDQTGKVWTHLITMDYPIGGLNFRTSTSSFMENPGHNSDGSVYREVHYGHGYKRLLNHTWVPFNSAKYHVNQGDKTANWNHNYNAGVHNDYFFMELGQTVHPSPHVQDHTFHLAAAMPAKPTNPAIHFSISKATHDEVEWSVPVSSTPQFNYSVDVDGTHIGSGIDPQKKSVSLSHVSGHKVTVTLEDILGNKTTVSEVMT